MRRGTDGQLPSVAVREVATPVPVYVVVPITSNVEVGALEPFAANLAKLVCVCVCMCGPSGLVNARADLTLPCDGTGIQFLYTHIQASSQTRTLQTSVDTCTHQHT